LGGFLERTLYLADADDQRSFSLASLLYDPRCKEMRLAGAATAVGTFIARGGYERLEYCCCPYFENAISDRSHCHSFPWRRCTQVTALLDGLVLPGPW